MHLRNFNEHVALATSRSSLTAAMRSHLIGGGTVLPATTLALGHCDQPPPWQRGGVTSHLPGGGTV